MKRKTAVFVALAAALLVGMAIAAAVNSPLINKTAQTYFENSINDTEYENIALQHIAQTHGIPTDELEVRGKVLRHFPAIDREVWQMRVVGTRNRSLNFNESSFNKTKRPHHFDFRMYEVFVDSDGEVIDKDELLLNAKPAGAGNDTELDYENIALRYIAQTHGIPVEKLIVGYKVQPHYWVIDKKLWLMKVHPEKWNINNGPFPVYEVCVDLDGNIVNESEFREQDQKAYREKYGKLEPDLYYRLQSMQPNETIRVVLWLRESEADSKRIAREVLSKYPNIEIIKNLTEPISKRENPNFEVIGHVPVFIRDGQLSREDRDKIRREIRAAKREAYALREKPLIDYLTAKGYEITGTSTPTAPIIGAILPKEEIIALQTRDDIGKIYRDDIKGHYMADTAVPTIRADKVWSEGHDGAGARIAIVEPDGVDFSNPYLPHGYMRPGHSDVGGHATECAGVAASTHPTFRGVAHNATILSANAADTGYPQDIRDASEWAINAGAEVLSVSYGWFGNLSMKWIDRYFDKVVYEDEVSVVVAAGNNGTTDGNVTSPGLGWNVITVGGIDDCDNPYWCDDDIHQISSYKDPESAHHDRNKPEVCAVSRWIRSTETQEYYNENGTWITIPSWRWWGTSYAAPAIAGEIALVHKLPGCYIYPEQVNPAILASATHNAYGDPIDDKEGLGTVDVSGAREIVREQSLFATFISSSTYTYAIHFNAVKGEKVRFVIWWCSHTNWDVDESYDVLESNFNLYIYDPQGNLVDYSYSYDNNYEVVDFTAPVSGEYEAKIQRIGSGPGEEVGCAWSRYTVESDFWCPLKVAVYEIFQFFKMSGGDTTYAWDFDNNGEIDSYEQDPEHYYEQEGLYTVSLTVTDSGGTCKETKYECIRAGPGADAARPLIDADFYATPRVGTSPLTVNFNDTSSGGEIDSWKWDFGDGTPPSYERNPQHTYYDFGAYDVSLEVTNTNGAKTKETKFDYVKPGYDVTIYVDIWGWWYEGESYNPSDTPIQDAVDHAGAGYEIIVYPGTYTEHVNIAVRHLTIRSLSGNPEDTVVQAVDPNWEVFGVYAPYVTISGFTITDATNEGIGIYLSVDADEFADNCIISNNIITNSYIGIWVDAPSYVTITDNTVSNNNDIGIFIDCGGSGHTIANNSVLNNNCGISLSHSFGGELTNNFVSDNYHGISIGTHLSNWVLTYNNISGNEYGIYIWCNYGGNNYLTDNYVCENWYADIHALSEPTGVYGDDNMCHLGYNYCDSSVCPGPPSCVYPCPDVGSKDLWIRDAFLDTWVVPGVNYTITYTVWNVGYETVSASTTGIIINGVRVHDDPVPALDPFGSYTNTVGPFNLTNPPAPDSITVCADIDDVISEDGWRGEENNCRENHFGAPDLIITVTRMEWIDLSWKTYNMIYTVKNVGDIATPHECWTNFTEVSGEWEGQNCIDPVPVPVLEVDESMTHTVGPFVMGEPPDVIEVYVDYNNTIVENNE